MSKRRGAFLGGILDTEAEMPELPLWKCPEVRYRVQELIGLTTRFRELAKFGWPPLLAFSAGVAVNVPLGFILSKLVFVEYWTETIK